MADPQDKTSTADDGIVRREFLAGSTVAMTGGLAASYGTLAVYALRYLYPLGPQPKSWMFVIELGVMQLGDSLEWEAPGGEKIVVARRGNKETAGDFIALSSVCPHLGCQVEWQPHKNRFFCPCHNGVFDPQGKAVEGPPAKAGQSLAHYPLKVEDGLLFIEVAANGVRSSREA